MQNALVVLNARAGAVLDRGGEQVKHEIATALGGAGRRIEVALLAGAAITRAIDLAASGGYDTIIVGGGDGTVSYAAHRLARCPIALGVLPLGTVNLLARDLAMPLELPAALAALASAAPRLIDLASINGRCFHSISGLGFFAQMARAREETRDLPGRMLRFAAAAVRAFARTGRFTLEVEIDGESRRIETYATLVTCNHFGGTDWRRAALDAGELEVHIAQEEGALARLKAGADLIAGAWRDNPAIHSYRARRIRIGGPRRRAWVTTDGELRRELTPLDYVLHPRALTVLAPSRRQ